MTGQGEQLIADYTKRGFQHVHIRRDQPRFRYDLHYHPHHVILEVLEGSLEIEMSGRKVTVGPKEKIEIESERFHTTCVGPEGCVYIHAEKPDSLHRPVTARSGKS